MTLDSILSLLAGIPIGIISGFYTGLIVTRYARFSDLRNEALRIVKTIEFIAEGSNVHVWNEQDVPNFALISSDLLFLGHKQAGILVSEVAEDIRSASHEARSGQTGVAAYAERYSQWQVRLRSMPPSRAILWSLLGKL